MLTDDIIFNNNNDFIVDNNIPMDFDTKEFDNYLSGCYLHGNLEKDNGFDMFRLKTTLNINKKSKGIYHLTFNNRPCTLFKWCVNETGLIQARGLMVYDDDETAFSMAKDKYEKEDIAL